MGIHSLKNKEGDVDYTKQGLIKLLEEDTKPETILFLYDKDYGAKFSLYDL